MKTQLPTALIECIDKYINEEETFFQIKEKQRQLLNKKLINLWYIIFSSQIDDNHNTLKYYTNIPRENFRLFKFKFKTKVYQYNELLNFLNKWNLIEINHKYCSKNQNKGCGSFSKSYRIRTEYLSGTQMSDVEIDFTKIFKNTKSMEYWLKIYPEYSNLIVDCYNTTIKLDEFIHYLYQNQGMKLKFKLIDGRLMTTYLTAEKTILYINKVLKLHFKNLWFKVSDEGRFYSSLTNLPSVSTKYLKLYDKDVFELDVSNCQPLLLARLLKNSEYQKDVENGVFYKRMADKIGECSKIKWCDKKFKILSYRYIFFSNNPLKNGKIYDALNNCYPKLMEQINNLIKDKNLALALQRMESSIFIEKIGKLSYHKITRHDSVLVRIEDYRLFENLIYDAFQEIGLKVTIKFNKEAEIALLINQF
jgi:hypothetical protein